MRTFFRTTLPPWICSVKYDGDRTFLNFKGGTVLDAEMIANEGKENDLYLLNSGNPKRISYRAFDVVSLDGKDLRDTPLQQRLAILQVFREEHPSVEVSEDLFWWDPAETLCVAQDFAQVIEARLHAIELGYEGIVVKPAGSLYRDDAWLKMKREKDNTFVILGVKLTKSYLKYGIPEAFVVGHYREGKYLRNGSVAAGLSKQEKAEIGEMIPDMVTSRDSEVLWIRPEICVDIRYKSVLPTGSLREPRLLRRRADKQPHECHAPS
jgi:bifunctional non-homologous end joining protein LigD